MKGNVSIMKMTQAYLIGWIVTLIGLLGLVTSNVLVRWLVWRYLWPAFIVLIGVLFLIIYGKSNEILHATRSRGLFLGLLFCMYGLFFYITLLLELRWTFILIALFAIIGGGGATAFIGGEDRRDSKEFDFTNIMGKFIGATDETKIEEIIIKPMGILGLFSLLQLTLSYVGGSYGGSLYPLVLVLTGTSILRSLNNYKLRKLSTDDDRI